MHRILFHFGPVTLYSYGLFVAMGFLISTFLMLRESESVSLSREDVFDTVIVLLISGLIGGRALFVVLNWSYYSHHPLRAFMFYEGGLAFQGAFLAAVIAGMIFSAIRRIPFWKTADFIAPYVALAHAIGRMGCFLNGCCYGKTIQHGLGVTYPGQTCMRIPTQIYNSLFLILLFLALRALSERKPFDGFIIAMYLMIYSLFRFFMDFFRGDHLVSLLPHQTLSQTICVGMFFAGVLIYAIRGRIFKKSRDNISLR